MLEKQEKTYRVAGLVRDDATGKPLAGATVEALDRGRRRARLLGTSVTGEDGTYEIEYDPGAAAEATSTQRRPNLFVRVRAPKGRLLASSERTLVRAAGPDVRIHLLVPASVATHERAAWTFVKGEPVDLAEAARLSREDLIALFRHLRRRDAPLPDRERFRRAFPRIFEERPEHELECAEGRGDAVRRLLQERLAQEGDSDLDADLDADLDLPVGATVHWHYTNDFRIKYTTDAAFPDDAVDPTLPTVDENVLLEDGMVVGTIRANLADLHPDNTEVAPIYVQKVGLHADFALQAFLNAPFSMRDPRPPGDRIEYRIEYLGGAYGSTFPTQDWVELSPMLTDMQLSFTVGHELMHRVQYEYNDASVRDGLYGAIREGGARFAMESINDVPNRYVWTAGTTWLSTPWESLVHDAPGVSNPIQYGLGLLWKYLAEHHSPRNKPVHEPGIGVDAYHKVLFASATVQPTDPGVGYDMSALRAARRYMSWWGKWDRFYWLDAAMTELSHHETTWGNVNIANWVHGLASPQTDRRFEYLEDDDAITYTVVTEMLADYQALKENGSQVGLLQGGSVTFNIVMHKAWAARYFDLRKTGVLPARAFRIDFAASNGMTDPLVQILRMDPSGAILDIHRMDKDVYTKTVLMDGVDHLIINVAARDTAGDFTLTVDEVPDLSDVHITRWHTMVGKEYMIDPRGFAWTWISPDIMVDTDGDGLADPQVYFDQDNVLKVRLRNRGNLQATGVEVDFWYQKATGALDPAAWIPITDAAGVLQRVTGATLEAMGDLAGLDEQWFSVNWAPADDGSGDPHWCVKALVTSPGDPNTDNKMALSNFTSVVTALPPSPDIDPDAVAQNAGNLDADGDMPAGQREQHSPWSHLVRMPEQAEEVELQVVSRGARWSIQVEETPEAPRARRKAPCPVARPVDPPIAPPPKRLGWARLALHQPASSRPYDRRSRLTRPRRDEHYPVNPDTLPPGVDPEDLVTVVHVIDGEAVGGVTFRVETTAPKPIKKTKKKRPLTRK